VRAGFADDHALDTAVSRAMLTRASQGHLPETFRIHVPRRVVAFGKHDTLVPGYAAAAQAAFDQGFDPVLRLAGGRAAVFHERTLAFSWTIPDNEPTSGIRLRFETVSALMVRAFTRLGIESRVGEIPGEYCPGEFSVNLGGRAKVMGVGQRLGRRAAHVGGVVVVAGSEIVRRVLVPVYRALDLEWRPETAGALSDAAPMVDVGAVTAAISAEIEDLAKVEESNVDAETMELAHRFASDHLVAGTARRPL
jgi:lipoate-protein ligase A